MIKNACIFLFILPSFFSMGQNDIEEKYFVGLKKYYQNDFCNSYKLLEPINAHISQEHIPLFVNTINSCRGEEATLKYLARKLDGSEYYPVFLQNQFDKDILRIIGKIIVKNNEDYLRKYNKISFLEELINCYDKDQNVREFWSYNKEISQDTIIKIDKSNYEFLKKNIQKITADNIDELGFTGITAMFNLVQHVNELKFKVYLLNILQNHSKCSKEQLIFKMFLYDRICVDSSVPQIFGTQYRSIGSSLEPYPIFSIEIANQERKKLNIFTIDHQIQFLQHLYKIKVF
jgi:hypothetical protein